MNRCRWTGTDELLVEYHDKEWGVPLHDDRKQFEFLCLEVFQCGLSWPMILRKREILRAAFDGFDPETVAHYDQSKIEEIMATEGVIHSVRKIKAVISNACAFLKMQKEFGSFSAYLWNHVGNKSVEYPGHADGSIVVSRNELSDNISSDLKKRGFAFLGSITLYSHLQAAGLINDHRDYCFRYEQLRSMNR